MIIWHYICITQQKQKLLFMKALLLTALFLVSTLAMAQYGTEGETYRYQVVDFPRYYVDQPNRTFSVEVNMPRSVSEYVDAEQIVNHIGVNGWAPTDPESAYLKIYIDYGAFLYESTDILDRSKEEKAKDGHVRVIPIFVGAINYTFPVRITITSPLGKIDNCLHCDKKLTYVTDHSFDNRRGAIEFTKVNRDVFIEQIITGDSFYAADYVNDIVRSDFGFSTTTDKVEFYYLDQKKSKYYSEQINDALTLKELVKFTTADSPVSENTVLPIIDRYINIINELNDGEKKQKKAKIKLMLSVAELYLLIEHLDESTTWAKRVMDEYKDSDGEDVLDKIVKVRRIFEKHHTSTRHFVPQAPHIDEE